MSTIENKFRRLLSSIGRSKHDPSKLTTARITHTGDTVQVYQDFTGDTPQEELDDEVGNPIRHAGDFPDHLIRRLVEIGKLGKGKQYQKRDVEEWFKQDRLYRIIHDLNNVEKHASIDNHKGGWSGLGPRLRNVRRIAAMTAGGNQMAGMMMDRTGGITPIGDGETVARATAEVVDGNGNLLGMAHDMIDHVYTVCEKSIDHFSARV